MKLLTPLTILFFVLAAWGQQEATTRDGRKVVLNSDGTWKYAAGPKDSAPAPSAGCSTYIKTVDDKVTGRSTVAGRERIIVSEDGGKTGFGILMMKSKDSIILSFTVVERGSGCINDDGTIYVLFRDGTRLQITHDSKFNCDGTASVYFGSVFGKRDALEQLKSKEIETVRVQTFKSYVERDLTPAQSKELMNQLKCLDEQK